MEIDIERKEKAAVIAMVGSMDTKNASQALKDIELGLTADDKNIVFDFRGLKYISSSGLRVVLTVAKKIRDAQGKVVFSGLEGMVLEVFEIAYFTTMFPVCDSVDDALKEI